MRVFPCGSSPDPRKSSAEGWVLQEIAARALGEVSAACFSANIPILTVKGVATSRLLYDDISQRPVADVDVRLRQQDFAAFRRLAREARWPCRYVSLTRRNVVHQVKGMEVDVECFVGPPGVCALTVEAMLGRASFLEISAGFRVLVPEIHDHAVLLTVNAFKDKLIAARPAAIADLERIVVTPPFRLEEFVARMIDAKVATLGWIVARWMAGMRGSGTWATVGDAIERGASLRRSYARLFRYLIANPARSPLALRILARASADRPLMRTSALLHAMLWEAETWLRAMHGAGSDLLSS